MRQKIEYLIKEYLKHIENMKWHKETNKNFLSESELININQRINDKYSVIEDLKMAIKL